MIIAIDGYSACGKSTLAKDLAKNLKLVYIDSGAMYRAMTLFFLEHQIDFNNNDQLKLSIEKIDIEFVPGENPIVLLNKTDVSEKIRKPEVSESVSEVAALPAVRKKLVQLQRRISQDKSVVMDGRDIGSVVFPNADIKFFLTADLDIRAKRRFIELQSKNILTDLSAIKENLIKRDYIDSTRTDSPLIKSPDAIVIDNTSLTRETQLQLALDFVQKQNPNISI